MLSLIPAVLSTKQGHDYVGGQRIWLELIAAHSDILKPLRTCPRGDAYWRRATIDAALTIAQQSGSLIANPEPEDRITPALIRSGRRFKPVSA